MEGTLSKSKANCLFVIAKKEKYALKDHFKSLNGVFNGVGWFFEDKHRSEIELLCEKAEMPFFEFPLDGESFEELKNRHRLSFFQEQAVKTQLLIENLKRELHVENMENDELITEDFKKGLELDSKGKRLIELIKKQEQWGEQIKLVEEEERLKKIIGESKGYFSHLVDTVSEDVIVQEMRKISPGIDVGYTINTAPLKIPGGAISILAGPTSHGKTATLINFALGALSSQNDKSVYFFSYEESRAAIFSLFLNTYINEILSRNNRESIRSYFQQGNFQFIAEPKRNIFIEKKKMFFENLISSQRLNIFYSEYTARELVAAIQFLKKNTNVGLICIDYMQLLTLGEGRYMSRQEELKQVCLILKNCAVDTGLPILLGAQFNRSVIAEADLSPTSIGEAGDIERVANLIIGFWNRNFKGFSREGNISKDNKPVPVESALYMEILKGREVGAGASEIMDFDGNTGKLQNRAHNSKSTNNLFNFN